MITQKHAAAFSASSSSCYKINAQPVCSQPWAPRKITLQPGSWKLCRAVCEHLEPQAAQLRGMRRMLRYHRPPLHNLRFEKEWMNQQPPPDKLPTHQSELDDETNNMPPAADTNRVRALDVRGSAAQLPAWSSLVSGERPAEFEIGSGKGLFMQLAAAQRPQHDFVGIELAAKFAHRAAQRLHRHQADNAKMLCGDAQRFIAEVVPDQSVVAVHVYFPDPWWRNKHKKRRVLNENVLADVVRVLKPGGSFHFWTDVLDYYEHICGCVMDLTALTGPRYVVSREAAHSMDYTTHFERRARLHGQPVYRAIFDKPPQPAEVAG